MEEKFEGLEENTGVEHFLLFVRSFPETVCPTTVLCGKRIDLFPKKKKLEN